MSEKPSLFDYNDRAGELNMRLPDRILRTPFLLGFKKETPQYAASAFVVAVPGAHGNSHLYVVTAKHLADRMDCCPIIMGFSYRDGSKALLEEDSVHWYAHPTEASAVDVAVAPFAPAQRDLLDLEPVPEHLFASGERMRKASIGVGDEIAAISVFTRFSYEDRHLPIVRTGHLAMLPTLRIPVANFDPMEAYVAEIEGLSGSPVWVRPTDYFNAAQKDGREENPSDPSNRDTEVIFLGLLHGRWAVSKSAMEGQSAQYTEKMVSGMSIVVPAHKILEVINQPELAAMRTKNDEKIAKKSSSAGSYVEAEASFLSPGRVQRI
jgi:hypothetical protein